MRYLLFITIILALTACATTAQLNDMADQASAKTDFPGKATVYVFRKDTELLGAWTVDVSVDSKEVGSVREAQYIEFPVEAQVHTIKTGPTWVSGVGSASIQGYFVPGHTYYFMCSPPSGARFELYQISADDAASLMVTYEKRPLEIAKPKHS